jgi:DNA-binding transcriptional LysR family regulator
MSESMDKLEAMRSFVRVVQTGSFSVVAREENTSQATISKRVAALENSLGAKLLTRSSRNHTMTEIGQSYYERCLAILDDVEEAEEQVGSLTANPRGKLKVTAPVDFARLYIAPFIAEFLRTYPEIKIELKLDDKIVGLISEDIDIAVRVGQLVDSSLVANYLCKSPLIAVTTPRYIRAHEQPKHPDELQNHNCLVYSLSSKVNIWEFTHNGHKMAVQVNGNFQCDNGEAIIEVLLADMGIAYIPAWLAAPYIADGRLGQILIDYTMPLPINAVHTQKDFIPLKTRCFINFLKGKLEKNPLFNK